MLVASTSRRDEAQLCALSYHEQVDDHEPDDADDPLIEALVKDVDLTLLRRNLALTPQQRLEQLAELQRFAAELAAAGRKARHGQ